MSEELRPCPFCGNKGIKDENLVTCPTVGDDSCCATSTIEEWQNAWCWKEIDRLEQQNEKMREEFRTIRFVTSDPAVIELTERALKEGEGK